MLCLGHASETDLESDECLSNSSWGGKKKSREELLQAPPESPELFDNP